MNLLQSITELLENRRHNRELYRSGKADRDTIVETTVGWRHDPWYRQDGMTEKQGDTPSGEREYSRVIRTKRK